MGIVLIGNLLLSSPADNNHHSLQARAGKYATGQSWVWSLGVPVESGTAKTTPVASTA